MIKKIILTASFTISILVYSQTKNVGINNNNPQQKLQISGSGIGTKEPTIRIDGLNSTNNAVNDGVFKRVYTTGDGDLVLVNSEKPITITPLPEKSLSSSDGEYQEILIDQTASFTLTKSSLVHFSGYIELNLDEEGSKIDGNAKVYGSHFAFISSTAASVATNIPFGKERPTFTANATLSTYGDASVNPEADLILPPGTYTVGMYGSFYGNNFSGFSNYVTNFNVASNNKLRFSILATPLSL